MNIRIISRISRQISSVRLLSSATNLTIYGNSGSQPARAVLMLCQANKIPYDFKVIRAVDLETKAFVMETRSPAFLAINPTGQVPAITDSKVGILAESGAILQYLAEEHKLTQWFPEDPVVRAKINFWLHWNHSNTRHGTMAVLMGVMFPKLFGAGFDAGKKKYIRAIKFLEASLVPGKFVAGTNEPTIADLALIVECDQLSPAAFNIFDFTPYPKVLAWMAAVEVSVPSYKAVFEPVVAAAAKGEKLVSP